MTISDKIRDEIKASGNTCVPYAKLSPEVRRAAYIIQDSKPRDSRYFPGAYCPCIVLSSDSVSVGVGNLPTTSYAVLGPDSELLGIITETRLPLRTLKTIKRMINPYDKYLAVEHDACLWFDLTTLSIIQLKLNDFTLSDYIIRSNELICADLDKCLSDIRDAYNYCLWQDFRKESSKDFDFEEVEYE